MAGSWNVIKYGGFCLWVLAAAMGCAGASRHAPPTVGESEGVPKQLQERQVIVTLPPASPEQQAALIRRLAREHHLLQVGAFPLTSLSLQCLVLQVPKERDLYEVMARLAADPQVESVQLNQVFRGLGVAYNDPYASLQYGARSIRADIAHQWATGQGVTVAVVDTGVESEHPDLHGHIAKTVNFVDGGERSFAQDRHGTAVTGVIAAGANNDRGIVGIAPAADIVAAKACWQRAAGALEAVCSSWTLAKAVDFTIQAGVQVLNMSLAGPQDPLLERLIRKAVDGGITVVAAAQPGGGPSTGFPASMESVIAVLASDPQGQVRQPGPAKTAGLLAAPGVDILTTVPGQAYDFMSGSSLAAAHVSGLVALLLERQPRLPPRQVYEILHATAQSGKTASRTVLSPVGVVDACAALAQLLGRALCP
jgi:subtilisin family serine protease